jgi:signal transduction histidine kinase
MRRRLPRTLFGQTLAMLLVGIGLALGTGAWIYASARQDAVRAVGALAAAERIVNLTRLLLDVPPEWRDRIVTGTNDPAFRIAISAAKPSFAGDAEPGSGSAIAALLQEALPGRDIAVSVRAGGRQAASGASGIGPPYGPGRGLGYGGGIGPGYSPHMMGPGAGSMISHRALGREAMSWRALDAAVSLGNGQWLAFTTTLPDTGPAMSPRLMLALLVSSVIIAALTAFAVRRATAPLRFLSDAAERLGRNVESTPLPLSGTIEMQRASAAFNEMQARLRRLIENRTLMLAAISHDLRTELTLLKLRAEAVEPAEDRERLLATVGEMEAMLTATLSFARDEVASEAVKRVDIAALAASVVDELADAGRPVVLVGTAAAAVAEVKPVAVKRALTNLIENAVKYGGNARVSLASGAGSITLAVDDDGPGIPEDQLNRVLQPFVRLEESRNRETGGMGLGLAIAASVADAHGGSLRLTNRPEGGLRATLALPAPGT